MEGDEDDVAQADSEQVGDEEREPRTDSGGTGGEDSAGRDEEGDVSAKRTDEDEDPRAPQAGRSGEREAESRRYRHLANENRDYRERLDRLERERELERQQWQRQQQQVNAQQEQQRLALMTPDERSEYYRVQDRQQLAGQLQQTELRMAMQLDKANYDAQARADPVYRRMAPEVERVFQEYLRQGRPVERQIILENLLGRQALNGAAKAEPARRQARKRVEAERVAPARPQGDRGQPARRMSTAEERLKDILI
jgi:hypothetical protein